MMLRIYKEADWPNMVERNTEGRKHGDSRTATKCRLKKKSDNRVSFPKENTLYYFYCNQQMHNQYQNSIYKYIYISQRQA